MNTEIAKAKVANALTSAASDHVIAVTADIYDETQGEYQSNINQNLKDEIEGLKSSGGGVGGGTTSGNLSEYAKIKYVDDEVKKVKEYTDKQIENIVIPELPKLAAVATSGSYNDLENTPTIPTALSELSEDDTHLLVTDNEKQNWNNKSNFSGNYNDLKNLPIIPNVSGLATREEVETALTAFGELVGQALDAKQDKTAIVTATNNTVSVDKRSVIDVNSDVVISLESYESDGYAHSYEIVLNVGDTAYSVAFPESVKWVKDLEIVANTTYSIVIEDNLALYVAI